MIEELNPSTSKSRARDAKISARTAAASAYEDNQWRLGGVIPVDVPGQVIVAPAVGDPNSQAKGSGARWNAGKVPYDMLPIQLLNDWLGKHSKKYPFGNGTADEIVAHIGSFQAGDDASLDLALAASLGEGTELEKFAGAAQVFQHVTTRVVKPYPKWNWMKGMKWSVPIGCILRHAQAIQRGESADPETGFPHMAHIQCNLIMLLLYRETYREGDDRPPADLLKA